MHTGQIIDLSADGIYETLCENRTVFDREILHSLPGGNAVPISLSVIPIRVEDGKWVVPHK